LNKSENILMRIIGRLFSTKYMVRRDKIIDTLPDSKEAYGGAVKLAVPAVIEMVGIALMGLLDTIMVGVIGDHAVAAVGLTNQPRFIFFSFFFALNIAVTAIIARYKGAGNQSAANACLRIALLIGVVIGSLLTLVSILIANPLMQFSGAQYDTIEPATEFFRITMYGFMFAVLSQTICAAQRAAGNTRLTMIVNIVANVAKVIFNFLLIQGRFGFPEMGIRGAGVSMVIANVLAFTLAAASLFYKGGFIKISFRDSWKPDLTVFRSLIKVTSGSLVEQVGLRIGFFAYALVIANLGTNDFVAHQIGMQVMNITFTFADGIAVASTALVGQSLGKLRTDLAVMYGKIGLRLALIAAGMLCVGVFLVRNRFPLLIATDETIVQTATGLMTIIMIVMPILVSQVVLGGTLRGSGDTKFVAVTMILTVGLLRPLLGFLLTYTVGLGLIGAWLTIIIDQLARLIMLGIRFLRGKWLLVKL